MVDTRDIRYINIQCKLHSQLQDSIPQITFILFSPVQLTGDLVLYIIIGRSSCIGSGMCGLNYHNHLIIYSYCPLKKLEPPNFYSFCGGGDDAIFQNLANGLHSYKLRNSGNSWVRGFSFSDGLMYSSQLKLINIVQKN